MRNSDLGGIECPSRGAASTNLLRLLALGGFGLWTGLFLCFRFAAGGGFCRAGKYLVPAADEFFGCARVNCVSGHVVLAFC